MPEAELVRMEELAFKLEIAYNTVRRVARDRQADRFEVDADLVCPPRVEAQLEQRPVAYGLLELEPRDRVTRRVGVDRMAGSIPTIPAHPALHAARLRFPGALDQ